MKTATKLENLDTPVQLVRFTAQNKMEVCSEAVEILRGLNNTKV